MRLGTKRLLVVLSAIYWAVAAFYATATYSDTSVTEKARLTFPESSLRPDDLQRQVFERAATAMSVSLGASAVMFVILSVLVGAGFWVVNGYRRGRGDL